MTIYLPDLATCIDFPHVSTSLKDPDGLLCMGGDLSVNSLIRAYNQGIFPWYGDDEPILWWSPSQRMVLPPESIHISKSLRKSYNKCQPQFFLNRNFELVINTCAQITRKQPGRWIHDEMIEAYLALYHSGHGFCIEVEINGKLAGGLYGVKTPRIFSGESMFSTQKNGSKYAMLGLCAYLQNKGIRYLDCQLYNPHLASMGGQLISRNEFISDL